MLTGILKGIKAIIGQFLREITVNIIRRLIIRFLVDSRKDPLLIFLETLISGFFTTTQALNPV